MSSHSLHRRNRHFFLKIIIISLFRLSWFIIVFCCCELKQMFLATTYDFATIERKKQCLFICVIEWKHCNRSIIWQHLTHRITNANLIVHLSTLQRSIILISHSCFLQISRYDLFYNAFSKWIFPLWTGE